MSANCPFCPDENTTPQSWAGSPEFWHFVKKDTIKNIVRNVLVVEN